MTGGGRVASSGAYSARDARLPRPGGVGGMDPSVLWYGAGTAVALALLVAAAGLLREDFPAVLFAITGVVAVVGLRAPLVACAAAVAVTPTFGWVVVGPQTSAFQILVAAAALGTLWGARRELTTLARRLVRAPAVPLAVAFVAWTAVSTLANRGPADPGYLRNYAGALVLMLVVGVLARTPRARAILLSTLVVATTATAVVGLAQVVSTDALVSAWVQPSLRPFQDDYARLASPWGLATVGSEYGKDVLVGTLVALPLAWLIGRRWRWLFGVAAGILVTALAMSGSRSAWLAGIVGLVVLALPRRPPALRLTAVAVTLLLAVPLVRPSTPVDVQVALGLSDGQPRAMEPAAGGGDPTGVGGVRTTASTDASDIFRTRLNRAAWSMARDHPVLGVGPGAFRERVDDYLDRSPAPGYGPLPERLPPHNVYLGTLAESGVPGALLYLGFLVALLVGVERRRRRTPDAEALVPTAVGVGLVGLLVTSAFHNYQYDNLQWLLAGLGLSLAMWPASRPSDAREPASRGAPSPL